MEAAMIAAHLGNASLDDVTNWSLRRIFSVIRRSNTVLPLLNPLAQPKTEPVREPMSPEAAKAIASMFGLRQA